jgi:hypothetical protein
MDVSTVSSIPRSRSIMSWAGRDGHPEEIPMMSSPRPSGSGSRAAKRRPAAKRRFAIIGDEGVVPMPPPETVGTQVCVVTADSVRGTTSPSACPRPTSAGMPQRLRRHPGPTLSIVRPPRRLARRRTEWLLRGGCSTSASSGCGVPYPAGVKERLEGPDRGHWNTPCSPSDPAGPSLRGTASGVEDARDRAPVCRGIGRRWG